MALKIQALSGVKEKGKLNQEWMVVVNERDTPFNLEGCSISVARGSKTR